MQLYQPSGNNSNLTYRKLAEATFRKRVIKLFF